MVQLLRTPLTILRLVVATPAIYAPLAALAAWLALAWFAQFRNSKRLARLTDWLGLLVGAFMVSWFFQFGQVSWQQTRDWETGWTYFAGIRQAVQSGELPYLLRTASQGTERYFANAETLIAPHAILLGVMSPGPFLIVHMLACFTAGYVGLLAIRRELRLSPFSWGIFVTLFLFNGHIGAHFNAGHMSWAGYYLLPWVLLGLIRAATGDLSAKNVVVLALSLAAMIVLGSWHLFVFAYLQIVIFLCSLRSWRAAVCLARISALVALLAAIRLVPGTLTFGGGANQFVGGFPSLSLVVSALVADSGGNADVLGWHEYDTYIGWVGFGLLLLGAVPLRSPDSRVSTPLLITSAALALLSLDGVYEATLFRLPGFVSERVVTRLLILPVLAVLLLGCVRIDRWGSWTTRRHAALAIAGLLAGWSLAAQLLLRTAGWRPSKAAAGLSLPTDVLKPPTGDDLYVWSVRVGAAISLVALVSAAVMLLAYRQRPVVKKARPAP